MSKWLSIIIMFNSLGSDAGILIFIDALSLITVLDVVKIESAFDLKI